MLDRKEKQPKRTPVKPCNPSVIEPEEKCPQVETDEAFIYQVHKNPDDFE